MCRFLTPAVVVWLALSCVAGAQSREEKVRADRRKVEAEGFWIYGDLAKGFAEAKKSGKPLLVVLRCIPCVECVKLDDELINRDRLVQPLLKEFVCVRLVSTNGLDLSLFQFDYDQSFAVLMLNADRTIYGRFGTRSHRTDWADDVSIKGLAKALEGALEIHQKYPANKDALAGKMGRPAEIPSPEKYPQLRDKYGPTLDYDNDVVKGCIHCHQIGDAQRQLYRDRKQPIPEELLFSYPHPKTLGLILDPNERATVLRVEKGSLAEQVGLQPADELISLDGQPLLSIADVQWVLQQAAPTGAKLQAKLRRDNNSLELALVLPPGWRKQEDISWRASTWNLRRMATGGLVLAACTSDERKAAGIDDARMALRVKFVGQYGAHAAGKEAGFRQGDIILAFDGNSELERETDLLRYALETRKPGERVPVKVLREGKQVQLTLPMQD
jgi:hypothetical protein